MQATIPRSERICIDISDSVVSIIKLDPEGIMMRAGSAKAPTMPSVPDDAYVTDLSAAIRKAAWAAKVSMGFGVSCVISTGMPDIVLRRFTWPDMPEEALASIIREEMMPYLSGDPTHYTVSCEVLRQFGVDGYSPPTIEVLAAAIPIEYSAAINTACRWANFKPKRMDVRENARGRLVNFWCAPVEGEVPSTYAVLDVGPGLANIAFYYNGMFHSSQYFSPELVKLEEVDDFELLMTVKAGGVDDNENAMRYGPDKLTGDIVSAIHHFTNSVPGARLSCALLMDEENIPGIEDSLRAAIGMPVLKPSQWVSPGLKRPNLRRVEQDQFLDAFAVGMPPLSGHGTRMDLRMLDAPSAVRTDYQPIATLPAAAPEPIMAKAEPVSPHEATFTGVAQEPVNYDDILADALHESASSSGLSDPYSVMPSDAPPPAFGMPSDASLDTPPFGGLGDPYAAMKPAPLGEIPLGSSPLGPSPFESTPFESNLYDSKPFDPSPLASGPFESSPFESDLHKPRHEPSHGMHEPFPPMPGQPEPFAEPFSEPFSGLHPESHPGTHTEPHPGMHSDSTPKHHEVPFDPVQAHAHEHKGFPYAMPEDPRPPRSLVPIFIALGIAVFVFLVAVLVPSQETRRLRNELQYLQSSIAAHASTEALFMLERERGNIDMQIRAIRSDIDRINEERAIVRQFYLNLPAQIMIPEIVENAGFHVDYIDANEHHIQVRGRTNAFRALPYGQRYLSRYAQFSYLLSVSFDLADIPNNPDDYGFVSYIFDITLRPHTAPFWLNGHMERRWQ